MKRREKPLSETNPYLRDPKLRDKMIVVAVASSAAQAIGAKRSAGPGGGPASAIEGIRVPQKVIAKGLRLGWKPPRQKRRS
jgi:hypothetical protein